MVRFISTAPDQGHLGGLVGLDDHLGFLKFYCVANKATKASPTEDFKRYIALRDSDKAFHISKGCTRRWMNKTTDERGSSGINILWPDTSNQDYVAALAEAAVGGSPHNMSCIIKYTLEDGPTVLWMGDLETDFMSKIEDQVDIGKVHILFAPHHGRASGKVPESWLGKMNPQLVIIGEAPSANINYYSGYDTITQNSSGDILFDAMAGKVDIYVGDAAYNVNFLVDDGLDHKDGLYYIGSLYV